jgi:hypothetical protein
MTSVRVPAFNGAVQPEARVDAVTVPRGDTSLCRTGATH